MKTIKIKDIEISAEELRRIVSENKELLNEPEVKGRYFFPEEGETYCYINSFNEINIVINGKDIADIKRISYGNCYRNIEEAQLALDKQKAIVACWKWAQENAPFEPDWGDKDQVKYYVCYNHKEGKLDACDNNLWQFQFTLPYFGTKAKRDLYIKACKEHLELLFTK